MAKFTERSASKILETMNDESQCKDIVDRYATSKLFNLFLAREIAKLPQAQGVVVKYVPQLNSTGKPHPHSHSSLFSVVAPGLCASELGRDLGLPPFAL